MFETRHEISARSSGRTGALTHTSTEASFEVRDGPPMSPPRPFSPPTLSVSALFPSTCCAAAAAYAES